jgi:hypothetical protein
VWQPLSFFSSHSSTAKVFVEPLTSASPSIIGDANRQQNFISTVFWNLDQICLRHEHMLEELFERQQEQHPLVQSVADIILECGPVPLRGS